MALPFKSVCFIYNVDKKFSLSVTFLLAVKHSWFVVFVCMVVCLR